MLEGECDGEGEKGRGGMLERRGERSVERCRDEIGCRVFCGWSAMLELSSVLNTRESE